MAPFSPIYGDSGGLVSHLEGMGKSKARARQLERARKCRRQANRENARALQARQFAYSILMTGSEPGKLTNSMLWNSIPPPPKTAVYQALREICEKIVGLARKSMKEVREGLPPNTVISFDGSWEHRRNANRCLFTVIQQGTGKVVFSTVISRKIEENDPHFCANPILMEATGLKLAVECLKDNPNIIGYVHDNDAKADKIIREAGWEIKAHLDPGHCFNGFKRRLDNFEGTHGHILKDIRDSLTRWMKMCCLFNGSDEEKLSLWRNCLNHYCGDHSQCPAHKPTDKVWRYADNPEMRKLLSKFLESIEPMVLGIRPEYSTQSNESFHKEKLKYATKDGKWGWTWEARMMCAVLDRNMANWKLKLFDLLKLPPLDPFCRYVLECRENDRIERNRMRNTEEFRRRSVEERERERIEKNRIAADQRQYCYDLKQPYFLMRWGMWPDIGQFPAPFRA